MQTLDNSTLETAQVVGQDEFPFYSNEPIEQEPVYPQDKETWQNADTLANYRLSRASAPAPNTVIPLLPSGKFPTSVIPSTAAVTTIYSRDLTKTYTLYVEADGALSLDRLT